MNKNKAWQEVAEIGPLLQGCQVQGFSHKFGRFGKTVAGKNDDLFLMFIFNCQCFF